MANKSDKQKKKRKLKAKQIRVSKLSNKGMPQVSQQQQQQITQMLLKEFTRIDAGEPKEQVFNELADRLGVADEVQRAELIGSFDEMYSDFRGKASDTIDGEEVEDAEIVAEESFASSESDDPFAQAAAKSVGASEDAK